MSQSNSSPIEICSTCVKAGEDWIIVSKGVSGEWLLEMSEGLDLLEVARVVGVIQNHAIELIQEQVSGDDHRLPTSVEIDQSITDTVEF